MPFLKLRSEILLPPVIQLRCPLRLRLRNLPTLKVWHGFTAEPATRRPSFPDKTALLRPNRGQPPHTMEDFSSSSGKTCLELPALTHHRHSLKLQELQLLSDFLLLKKFRCTRVTFPRNRNPQLRHLLRTAHRCQHNGLRHPGYLGPFSPQQPSRSPDTTLPPFPILGTLPSHPSILLLPLAPSIRPKITPTATPLFSGSFFLYLPSGDFLRLPLTTPSIPGKAVHA